jgi:methionyl-tRNA synthetase
MEVVRDGPRGVYHASFRGSKFSKSRGAFVEVPYSLSRYDPDPLRLYLTATASCTSSTT